MRPIEIASAETHDLRRRVLRDADPTAPLDWPGDDDPATFHLGIRDDAGNLCAVSTWLARPDPDRPGSAATQLRGMATEATVAGTGLGSVLLAAGIERCRARGDEIVWANARRDALGFYQRAGFIVIGPEFTTADTGIPHRRIRLQIGRHPISPSEG